MAGIFGLGFATTYPMNIASRYLHLTSKYRPKDTALREEAWQGIMRNYQSIFRRYHNLDHISDMLTKLQGISEFIHHPMDTELAIIYHDVVYDPVMSDNEEQSADRARADLSSFGFPVDRLDRIAACILATKDHRHAESQDVNYLLDLDLSIWGQTPEVYRAYCKKIREEYIMFPDAVYRAGRRKILQNFLDRDVLYHTHYFRSRLETAARINIENELRLL